MGGPNRRCDCDGYRPDTLGSGIGLLPFWRYGTPEFILVEWLHAQELEIS